MIKSIKSVLPNRLDPATGKPLELNLDLFNPYKNGFAVTSVTNTGPLKANTVMDDWATVPGGRKNTDHISYRNIVMKLEYVGQSSIEDLRHLTYKYFPVREDIRLEFTTDTRVYCIDGHIDDNGVPMWTKNESSTISIMCGNPFFYDKKEYSYDFETVVPLFNFFFPSGRIAAKYNDVWTTIQKQPFPVSKKIRRDQIVINNPSSQTIGLIINFKPDGIVENPKFYNMTTNEAFLLNGTFATGSSYTIDTRPGHKGITRSDGVNYISHFLVEDSSGKKSKWIQLLPGENVIKYDSGNAGAMDVSVSIRPLYEGI